MHHDQTQEWATSPPTEYIKHANYFYNAKDCMEPLSLMGMKLANCSAFGLLSGRVRLLPLLTFHTHHHNSFGTEIYAAYIAYIIIQRRANQTIQNAAL